MGALLAIWAGGALGPHTPLCLARTRQGSIWVERKLTITKLCPIAERFYQRLRNAGRRDAFNTFTSPSPPAAPVPRLRGPGRRRRLNTRPYHDGHSHTVALFAAEGDPGPARRRASLGVGRRCCDRRCWHWRQRLVPCEATSRGEEAAARGGRGRPSFLPPWPGLPACCHFSPAAAFHRLRCPEHEGQPWSRQPGRRPCRGQKQTHAAARRRQSQGRRQQRGASGHRR